MNDANILTREQERLVAGLVGDPGYMCLCDLLDGYVLAVEEQLRATDSPRKAVRLWRFWKFLKHFTDILKAEPQNIAQELDAQYQQSLAGTDPLAPPPNEHLLQELYAIGKNRGREAARQQKGR